MVRPLLLIMPPPGPGPAANPHFQSRFTCKYNVLQIGRANGNGGLAGGKKEDSKKLGEVSPPPGPKWDGTKGCNSKRLPVISCVGPSCPGRWRARWASLQPDQSSNFLFNTTHIFINFPLVCEEEDPDMTVCQRKLVFHFFCLDLSTVFCQDHQTSFHRFL